MWPVTAVYPLQCLAPPTILPVKGGAGVFVGLGVGVLVGGREVGLVVDVGVAEGIGVCVSVGVRVGVGVSVGRGVSVGIGVVVGVSVGIGVGEGVRVLVGVTVEVKVGLGVRVGVAVTLASRWGKRSVTEQARIVKLAASIAKTVKRFFIRLPTGPAKDTGRTFATIIAGLGCFGKNEFGLPTGCSDSG